MSQVNILQEDIEELKELFQRFDEVYGDENTQWYEVNQWKHENLQAFPIPNSIGEGLGTSM